MDGIYRKINRFETSYKCYPNDFDTCKDAPDTFVIDEDNILIPMYKVNEYVPITITRADFYQNGYDATNISDEEMIIISQDLGDMFLDDGFSYYIDAIAKRYNLPSVIEDDFNMFDFNK